ncbi:MAG: ABC transporter ATP-binding protein/permease [Sphingobacteriaceae bacterium]|nr:ABC transporter ATP-binding protein/permease [Sphingobacteriaceae bacterium]
MPPLKRFYKLLSLDKKDVYQILLYAIFAGLISLTLPLGIQTIINFIQSGRVSASWIVLVFVVVFGVGLGGVLSLMQLRITENLQQKLFIRSSFEFATRLPKIKFEDLYNKYPPELANCFFDTLTIQKGTSKLLIDFSAALLQITFGIILLSLYHPFFIVFGFLLATLLFIIFKYSYNSGLETSMKESKYKYKVASWLQELARNSFSFGKDKTFDFSLNKNDLLVSEYLNYREKHFGVIKKQFIQLIAFKIIITASLLLIGGYFVISQQMNIGQFVAAEIIILLVINSVEKIIVGLETLYDVLTAVEKIGQITDLSLNEVANYTPKNYDKITLETDGIEFSFPESNSVFEIPKLKIEQGEKIFLEGENGSGKSTLIRLLSGILTPTNGVFYINDDSYKKLDVKQFVNHLGTIIKGEAPFEGSILENITFNDAKISEEKLSWAIEAVGLGDYIRLLPEGLNTRLYPEGRQLTASNAQKILLARSIIHQPKILFYENATDEMDEEVANKVIDFICNKQNNWTVVVSSKNSYWKNNCNRVIKMEKGKIISDTKK